MLSEEMRWLTTENVEPIMEPGLNEGLGQAA